MLENFIFENHIGQRFIGLENGVYCNSNDLRDFSWSYDSLNGRISRFYKKTGNKRIPLIVNCDSDEKAVYIKNHLTELSERDIVALKPGKIYIGDYYLNGYVTASKKKDYNLKKKLCMLDLTFTSEDLSWYCDKKHVFIPENNESGNIGGNTDYPFDYPYDYALPLKGRNIICDTIGENAFRLIIYGEAVNPSIIIGGHTYAINGAIGKDETLEIDSLTRTITLTSHGQKINWLDRRNRSQYIFQPIPSGQHNVSWIGTFGFDLIVIEKRSEPKWT